MELLKAIMERRSIRKFTDRQVDRALLERLIKAAMWAPSGMNRQPWKFIVLEGESLQRFIKFSAGMAENMEGPLRVQNFNDKMRAFVKGYFRDLGGARTVLVCLAKAADTYLADHANMVSGAAALYNFLLLAHEAGLACCWMTGYALVESDLMRFLGVEGYKLVGVTPVGFADQIPPVPPRKHEDIIWME
ncbi:MAG: nitroreductase family protein [Desulfovibrio sp.]|jgi:nitroreductase|nr:nitroreductase family protein [Desulfovibrio sp.]